VGGHGHHRNKCKKNYLVEKKEYTKKQIADCVTLTNTTEGLFNYYLPTDDQNDKPDCGSGVLVTSAAECNQNSAGGSPCCKAFKDSPIDGVGGEEDNDPEGPCTFDCAKQGTAACTSRCQCDAEYNQEPINRGLVKSSGGNIYYASMIEPDDISLDGNGLSSFRSKYYKSNILFATNITELGSQVLCDIDEAPFIMDDLEPTTYKASEEELSVDISSTPYQLKEKDGEINLRAYVEFTCTGPRCMNIKSSLTQSQIGSELLDLDDDSLEVDSCVAYADINDDIRRYFCQRFGTFTPTWSGPDDSGQVIDMKVNYVRPGGSKGENYYETFTEKTIDNGNFAGEQAYIDDGDDGVPTPGDIILLDGTVNDGDPVTPGDRCGYWPGDVNNNNDLSDDLGDIRYFYSMSLHDDDLDDANIDLKDFPKEESKLNPTTANFDTDNPLVDDDYGITPRSSQTPYFFYFGLVPGRTSLHKAVAKFFADKIDKNTLGKVTEKPTTSPIPPNNDKKEAAQAVIGSCIKTI
jgi:hypothetical protein